MRIALITIAVLLIAIGAVALFARGIDTTKGMAEEYMAEAQASESNGEETGAERDVLEKAKGELTPEQIRICVGCGTEPPFNNKYYDHHEDGIYHCAVCEEPLFSSETKYDSGSGWPAFYDAIDKGKIRELEDTSLGMRRVEVRCGNCDAHLGHLFTDGPQPTGMRYCINSASLDFKGAEENAGQAEEEADTSEQ